MIHPIPNSFQFRRTLLRNDKWSSGRSLCVWTSLLSVPPFRSEFGKVYGTYNNFASIFESMKFHRHKIGALRFGIFFCLDISFSLFCVRTRSCGRIIINTKHVQKVDGSTILLDRREE